MLLSGTRKSPGAKIVKDIKRADEAKDLHREAGDLKEVVAEQTLELRILKKHDVGKRPSDPLREF